MLIALFEVVHVFRLFRFVYYRRHMGTDTWPDIIADTVV